MKLSQFKFKLPEDRIALYPTFHRDESRLMVLHKKSGASAPLFISMGGRSAPIGVIQRLTFGAPRGGCRRAREAFRHRSPPCGSRSVRLKRRRTSARASVRSGTCLQFPDTCRRRC